MHAEGGPWVVHLPTAALCCRCADEKKKKPFFDDGSDED